MTDKVENLYRQSGDAVRASFGQEEQRALAYYKSLIDFVAGVSPPTPPGSPERELLDVGCGSGWSTFGFARRGYRSSGIDLNPAAFEPPQDARCALFEGSALDISFPNEFFDVVVTYQCLEHIPQPQRALEEMCRVCRPGGVVAVVGPNLVSPARGLALLVTPWWWKIARFRRTPEMPHHPYGNTVGEVFRTGLLRIAQLAKKLARAEPQFIMRKPDDAPPFFADNDACYLCNPLDLIHFFRRKGMTIERKGRPGRPPLAYLLAGGTWVAARKS